MRSTGQAEESGWTGVEGNAKRGGGTDPCRRSAPRMGAHARGAKGRPLVADGPRGERASTVSQKPMPMDGPSPMPEALRCPGPPSAGT